MLEQEERTQEAQAGEEFTVNLSEEFQKLRPYVPHGVPDSTQWLNLIYTQVMGRDKQNNWRPIADLRLLVITAARVGLDPLARQIFPVYRFSDGKNVMTIQVSIDGMRVIAARTGLYAGQDAPVFHYWSKGPDGKAQLTTEEPFNEEESPCPAIATVTVYRLVPGTGLRFPYTASARWEEYAQLRNGKPLNLWASHPHVMLAKCAEAQALRKAFPQDLSGLYAEEEMGGGGIADDLSLSEEEPGPEGEVPTAPQPEPTPKEQAPAPKAEGNPAEAKPKRATPHWSVSEANRTLVINRAVKTFGLDAEDLKRLVGDRWPTFPGSKEALAYIEQHAGWEQWATERCRAFWGAVEKIGLNHETVHGLFGVASMKEYHGLPGRTMELLDVLAYGVQQAGLAVDDVLNALDDVDTLDAFTGSVADGKNLIDQYITEASGPEAAQLGLADAEGVTELSQE
jgi:phage recombination protein Bet